MLSTRQPCISWGLMVGCLLTAWLLFNPQGFNVQSFFYYSFFFLISLHSKLLCLLFFRRYWDRNVALTRSSLYNTVWLTFSKAPNSWKEWTTYPITKTSTGISHLSPVTQLLQASPAPSLCLFENEFQDCQQREQKKRGPLYSPRPG